MLKQNVGAGSDTSRNGTVVNEMKLPTVLSVPVPAEFENQHTQEVKFNGQQHGQHDTEVKQVLASK